MELTFETGVSKSVFWSNLDRGDEYSDSFCATGLYDLTIEEEPPGNSFYLCSSELQINEFVVVLKVGDFLLGCYLFEL